MAKEFKTYLAEFTKLCDNYCENAKRVVPGPDYVKLVKVYQKGLAGSCAGLSKVLNGHYDSADKERRRQMDEFVQLSGVLPLLEEANLVIGKNSLDDAGALFSAGGIFHELKKIIRLIPGLAAIAVPGVGAIPGLLDLIDQFIDAIGKLFGGSPGASKPGGTTVEKPPPIPTIDDMVPCKWYPVYSGDKVQTFQINSYDAGDAVEVRVDEGIPKDLEQGLWMPFTGRKIEVHLKAGRSAPAGVGYKSL